MISISDIGVNLLTFLCIFSFFTICFYRPLRIFFDVETTIKLLIPFSISMLIIIVTPLYFFEYSSNPIIFVVFVVIIINFVCLNFNTLPSTRLKFTFYDLLSLVVIFKVSFFFNLTNIFYGYSDLFTHAKYLKDFTNLQALGYELSWYPPGWYLLNTLYVPLLDDLFIFRFLGPSIGFFCLLAIYLMIRNQNALMSLSFFLIILIPIPGFFVKMLIFSWPFQLVLLLSISVIFLIKYILNGNHKFFIILFIYFSALGVINYYFAYIIYVSVFITSIFVLPKLTFVFRKIYFLNLCLSLLFSIILIFALFTKKWNYNSKKFTDSIQGFVNLDEDSFSSHKEIPKSSTSQVDQVSEILYDILIPDVNSLYLIPIVFFLILFYRKYSKLFDVYTTFLYFYCSFLCCIYLFKIIEIDSFIGRSYSFIIVPFLLLLQTMALKYTSNFKILVIPKFIVFPLYIMILLVPTYIKLLPSDYMYIDYLLSQYQSPQAIRECSDLLKAKDFFPPPEIHRIYRNNFCGLEIAN